MYLGDDGGVDGSAGGDVSVGRNGDEAVGVSDVCDGIGGGDRNGDVAEPVGVSNVCDGPGCSGIDDGDQNGDGDVDCGGCDDDDGDEGAGVGANDLFSLRNKIKNSIGPEKVRGCILLLHAWDASKDKKSYSSLKTFMTKVVRPVCNCLRNHHGGNIDLFVAHHDVQNSIHNFYKKCRGNINSTCVSD